ncbi:MAG: sulfotransferase family protein [Actinomycetes bacterium]
MTEVPRLVLLVGAPRSGTTWLQTMLGAHPDVVTPQETDLFSRYLQPLLNSWAREETGGPERWARRRYKGLHSVLTDDEFTEVGRAMLETIVSRASALRPGSSFVVEKTPAHSQCAEAIARFAPDAVVVHLVRDGRDAAASMVAASTSWGGWWAPRTVARAGVMWRKHVEGARRCAATNPYLEIRYEDLRRDGASALAPVFAHCGLAVDEATCSGWIEQYSLDRMSAGEGTIAIGGAFAPAAGEHRSEPQGFFGRAARGAWEEVWSTEDRLAFATVAGELLIELAYADDHAWAGDDRARNRYARRVARQRRVAGRLVRIGLRGEAMERRLP